MKTWLIGSRYKEYDNPWKSQQFPEVDSPQDCQFLGNTCSKKKYCLARSENPLQILAQITNTVLTDLLDSSDRSS